MVRDVKRESSEFISSKRWTPFKFEWQEGFGCFTCSYGDDLDRMCAYVQNQEEHHKNRLFEDEYRSLMKRFGVEYDERYLFD